MLKTLEKIYTSFMFVARVGNVMTRNVLSWDACNSFIQIMQNQMPDGKYFLCFNYFKIVISRQAS